MRDNPEAGRRMYEKVEQWQQSGLTKAAFCQQQSLKFHTFYYWYKKYNREHHPPSSENKAPAFVKLQVEKKVAATALVEVSLPGGVHLLFHTPVSANYLKTIIS